MISKIMSRIERYNFIRKYEKQEAYISKYFIMKNLPEEVRSTLFNARRGIADFAKEKDIKIIISSKTPENLKLEIKYPDYAGSTMAMSSDISKIYTHFDAPEKYKEHLVQSSYEDNFLRHLYRMISEIIK